MNKTILSILLMLTFLSMNLKAQTLQEEIRADFLTNYYQEYQNNLNSDTIERRVKNSTNEDLDSLYIDKRIKKNQYADSLLEVKKIENINANCLNSLYNENQGVVESAIYVSIQFKNKFPNENVSTLIDALDQIIKGNGDSRIHYKAQLAKMYINNIDWFENLKVNSIENEKEVYISIAQTLNGKLFSQEF